MAETHDQLVRRIQVAEDKATALEDVLRKTIAFHQATVDALAKATDRVGALEKKLGNHLTTNTLAEISGIYPKTNTVVFVGTGYFGDNIKYAFLAFCEFAKKHNIACYFLANDTEQHHMLKTAGLPCLMPFTGEGVVDDFYIMASAKIVVLADYFYPKPDRTSAIHALLQGAKFIQLWHGIPLKEIGLQSLAAAEIMAACGPYATLVATNQSSRDSWAQRFSFEEFAPLGYPRTDVLMRDLLPHDLINVDVKNLAAAETYRNTNIPVILYAPTFRNHEGVAWLHKAKLEKIADHCRAKNYALYVNLHPLEQNAVEQLRKEHPEIAFIEPHTDIYPFVKIVDIFVSDYSSLAFDFLLLDRPLVFYRPDHADYIAKSRPLIPGRAHYDAGFLTYSIDELCAALDAAVLAARQPEGDAHRKARQSLRKELYDYTDGKAAERMCELIVRHLETIP